MYLTFGFHIGSKGKDSWEMTFELAKEKCLPQPPLIPKAAMTGH